MSIYRVKVEPGGASPILVTQCLVTEWNHVTVTECPFPASLSLCVSQVLNGVQIQAFSPPHHHLEKIKGAILTPDYLIPVVGSIGDFQLL